MKIDSVTSIQGQEPTGVSARSATPDAGVAAHSVSQDRTTLSTSGEAVSTLVKAALESPAVRQDKVASLRAQVASGSYQINPAKIAQGIVNEEG